MPARSWTKEQLVAAVEKSTTIYEVVLALGLKYNSQTHRYIRDWILEYKIPTSNLKVDVGLKIKYNERAWTDEQLKEAVENSTSISQIAEKIKLRPIGSNYTHIKKHLARLGLSLLVSETPPRKFRTLEELLQKDVRISSYELKIKLLKNGIFKDECVLCKLGPVWRDKPIHLQLDHKNGDGTDNRLENLRILCPNCHSQTETFGNSTSHRERDSIQNRLPE